MSIGLRAGTNNDGYLQVNGTDVLTALSSGKIGIGTDTPAADIHLETSAYPTLKVQNTSGASGFPVVQLIDNRVNGVSFNIENGRTAGSLNVRDNTSVADRITLDSTGDVGIGTNNPQQKLHISGTGNTYTRVDSINGSDTTTLIVGSSASNGASYIDVSNTGSLSSYTDFKINLGGINMINCLKQGSNRMVSIGNGAANSADFDGLEVQGNFGINGGIIFDSTRRITRTLYPDADATYDFGAASFRWANIYSADLQLSNEGSANDVDGTWGQYTIQEGENDLFLLNRRNGKKYKFVLQEVN